MDIAVVLRFPNPKAYVGHPYWPERERLINLQKESGLNRVRSADKREKTLKSYLDTKGLTMDDYRALEAAAARPFYTRDDGEIVIPAHQLHGMAGQAADLAPSAVRLARLDQIRTFMQFEDFRTGKYKADGIWERFVPPKSGPGKTLSNQRGLRSDPYLAGPFDATGSLHLASEEHATKARQFVTWAGAEIGVGAARKMGWGRFVITRWDPA